jgi:hypothetical protein
MLGRLGDDVVNAVPDQPAAEDQGHEDDDLVGMGIDPVPQPSEERLRWLGPEASVDLHGQERGCGDDAEQRGDALPARPHRTGAVRRRYCPRRPLAGCRTRPGRPRQRSGSAVAADDLKQVCVPAFWPALNNGRRLAAENHRPAVPGLITVAMPASFSDGFAGHFPRLRQPPGLPPGPFHPQLPAGEPSVTVRSLPSDSVASTVPSASLVRISTSITRMMPEPAIARSSAATSPLKLLAPAGTRRQRSQ